MLLILIPIAVILILFLVLVLLMISHKKTMVLKAKKIDEEVNSEKIRQLDRILDRVHVIANANPKYIQVARQLNTIHDDYEVTLTRAKKLTIDLKKVVKSRKVNAKKFQALVNEIKGNQNALAKLDRSFREVAIQVTHQDEYIRNEFNFYQKNIRKVFEVYSDKRILLDKISSQIDALKNETKQLERKFEEVIVAADSNQADKLLRLYSKKVMHYTKVINEGPSIETHLYTQIPHNVKKINNLFFVKRDELSSSLKHIDFKNSIKKISEIYIKAKRDYENLKIDETKVSIRTILKSFKSIENMINLEIKSRNIFIKNYESVIQKVKLTLEHYVSIKKQMKEISAKGKSLTSEILESYHNVQVDADELDKLAIKFRNLMKDKNVPYSAKVSRMKLIIQKSKKTTVDINKLITKLWSINLDESMIKNKFTKSEAAINELIANIKKEDIQLSMDEQREFQKIMVAKSEIAKSLSSEVMNKDLTRKVDGFVKNVTTFYTLINGNAQIASHVKNLLQELAPRRVMDEQMNLTLQIVERNYLEGKYAEALNNIIEVIQEKGI